MKKYLLITILSLIFIQNSYAEEKPSKNVRVIKKVKKKVVKEEIPEGEVAVDPSGNTHINLGETSLMGDQDTSESLEIVAPGTEILNNKVKDRKHFNDRTYMDVLKIR